MSTETDPKPLTPELLQLSSVRRALSAADDRRVRRVHARIFAELLPYCTKRLAPGRLVPRLQPPADRIGESQPDGAFVPSNVPVSTPQAFAARTQKETLAMKAYRTESPYYFSSRQLLPIGSLVFFSHKINRYVHPTDGVLLNGYPRLQLLSEVEGQALEEQWKDALARY